MTDNAIHKGPIVEKIILQGLVAIPFIEPIKMIRVNLRLVPFVGVKL